MLFSTSPQLKHRDVERANSTQAERENGAWEYWHMEATQTHNGKSDGTSSEVKLAKQRLARILIQSGQVTQTQISEALRQQSLKGGEIIDILFSMNYLAPKDFLSFLKSYPNTVPSDYAYCELNAEIREALPPDAVHKYQVIPIDRIGDILFVATSNQLDNTTVESLQQITGCKVKSVICMKDDIDQAIERYYGGFYWSSETTPNGETALLTPNYTSRQVIDGLEVPLRLSYVAHLIQRIESLPALPETVVKVRQALHDEEIDMNEVVECIQTDPSIAAKVLRVANSAAYGFSHQIGELQHAVSLLGLRETYSIVLSASVIDVFSKWKNFDYRAFVAESLARAILTRMIGKAAKKVPPLGLFTAGLLADIGKAALWHVVPKLCEQVNQKLTGRDRIEEELRVIGLDHVQAGSELALHWQLPQEIITAIRYRHYPELIERQDSRQQVAAVALADAMVQAIKQRKQRNDDVLEDQEHCLTTLGLTAAQARAILREYLDTQSKSQHPA